MLTTKRPVIGRLKNVFYRYVAERPHGDKLFDTLRPKIVALSIPGDYVPCNPSLCFDGNGYVMSLRSVNYHLKNSGSMTGSYSEFKYDTINYLGRLSLNLDVLALNRLEDDAFRRQSPKAEDGFEDVRVFMWKEQLWGLASARNNQQDTNTMALLKLSGHEVVESHLIESPLGFSREKNWMTFVENDKLFAIHTMNPLTIVEIDEQGAKVTLQKPLKIPQGLLGSSQLVRWKDGWLCVVHERSRGKRYLYKHRFVYFDAQWNVTLSEAFYWRDYGVEFCCGLAVHDGRVTVGLGIGDSEAVVAQFNAVDIERLLEAG